jgi:peptidoglycan-associated lipoprotein
MFRAFRVPLTPSIPPHSPMKSSLFTRFAFLTLAVSALIIGGCANDKKGGAGGAGTTGEEGIYDNAANALPNRDESFNPDKADYSVLAPYTVYFGFDSFAIEPAERNKLEKIASYMKDHPDEKILLAGHTDERGTVQYNLSLGDRRAQATRDYLIGLGIDSNRLHAISYGEERPADKGTGEDSYAKNRRVAAGIIR